jgi:O-antigen ligase
MWPLFLAAWGLIGIVSGLVGWLTGTWELAVVLIGPMTLAGILWHPLFGLTLMCALMPIGEAIGFKGVFSAERGLGILFAVGAGANILITRKPLRFLTAPGLGLLGLASLALLSIMWATYPDVTVTYTLTLAQLFVFILLAHTLCRSEKDLRWPLRMFVIICMVALVMPRLFGMRDVAQAERLTIALGEQKINPNSFGVVLGLGLLTAVYLHARDANRIFRWVYRAAFAILPVGVLLSGSRKAVFALAAASLIPLILSPWVLKRLRSVIALVILGGLLAGSVYVAVTHFMPQAIVWRLTDPSYASESLERRLSFIRDATSYATAHPLGAGLGNFRTRIGQQVHNDLFYLYADLGFPGALVFVFFVIATLIHAWRMRSGPDKWYANGLVLNLFLIGLGGTWIYAKYYWLFMAMAWLLATFSRKARAETHEAPIQWLSAAPSPIPRAPSGPGMPGHVLQSR